MIIFTGKGHYPDQFQKNYNDEKTKAASTKHSNGW